MIYFEAMEIGETISTCTKGEMNMVHTFTKVSSNQYAVTVSCTDETFTKPDGFGTILTSITAETAINNLWNLLKYRVQK